MNKFLILFLFFISFNIVNAQPTREEVAVAIIDLFKQTKADKIRLVIDNKSDKIVGAVTGEGFLPYQNQPLPRNRLFIEVERIPTANTKYRLSIEGQKTLINNYRVVFNSFPEDLDPYANPALRKPQQLAIALEDGVKLANDPKIMGAVRIAAQGIARETQKAGVTMRRGRVSQSITEAILRALKASLKKPPKLP